MKDNKEYCTSCGYELQEGLCERCGNPQDAPKTIVHNSKAAFIKGLPIFDTYLKSIEEPISTYSNQIN